MRDSMLINLGLKAASHPSQASMHRTCADGWAAGAAVAVGPSPQGFPLQQLIALLLLPMRSGVPANSELLERGSLESTRVRGEGQPAAIASGGL